MTAEDMFNDVTGILNHQCAILYNEYGTEITRTICDKIIEAVIANGVIYDACEETVEAYQELIRNKGKELSKLLKIHGHSKDIQETAIFISKKMSGRIGHNKSRLVISCAAEV